MAKTLSEQLTEGIGLFSEATKNYDEVTKEHNDARVKMIKDVEAFKKKESTEISRQIESLPIRTLAFYDHQTHSKSSLKVVADPADDSKSKWQHVPNTLPHHMYTRTGSLIVINTRTGLKINPGHYENPQYKRDKSASLMQFIYARDSSTSDEINGELEKSNIEDMQDLGGWWNGVKNIQTTAVNVTKHHPYSRLFVRFVNKVISGDGKPQNIITYGGDSSFSIDSVENYGSINFKE